jgi:hypothetical protein
MNFIHKNTEKLDNLPSREKFPDHSRENYWGKDFPYSRCQRWLQSHVGSDIDVVISDFIHAEWIPKIYRTLEQLRRKIEFNTFIHKGKVCYYHNHLFFYGSSDKYMSVIEEQSVKTFYVDPETRKLAVFHPQKRPSYLNIWRKNRDKVLRILAPYHQYYKEDGIWYEVKAEILPADYNAERAVLLYARKGPNDILLQNNGNNNITYKNHPFVRIILKRQLSNKELKKNNLKND